MRVHLIKDTKKALEFFSSSRGSSASQVLDGHFPFRGVMEGDKKTRRKSEYLSSTSVFSPSQIQRRFPFLLQAAPLKFQREETQECTNNLKFLLQVVPLKSWRGERKEHTSNLHQLLLQAVLLKFQSTQVTSTSSFFRQFLSSLGKVLPRWRRRSECAGRNPSHLGPVPQLEGKLPVIFAILPVRDNDGAKV
ncbi:hypothetical protein E2C01_060019 [Portunus trituberculatus]|uniref:Uncharacterized protein n=1 Tax=Portunus trituberculatus TaxID=210409 RepID=A0A5B7GZW6_PORTR|nr:hypothetical protein [Portunus trituberculatus]